MSASFETNRIRDKTKHGCAKKKDRQDIQKTDPNTPFHKKSAIKYNQKAAWDQNRAWIKGGEMPASPRVPDCAENVWKEDVCGWAERCERMNKVCHGTRKGAKERLSRRIEIKGGKGHRRHASVCESVRGRSRRNSVRACICEGRVGGSNGITPRALGARSPMLRIHSITRHHWQGRFIRPPLRAADSCMPQPDTDKRVTLTSVFHRPSLKTTQLTLH